MKVFEKTKKSLYKTLFLMTSALLFVTFVSCKQPAGPEQNSEQPTEEDSGKAPEKKPEPPVDNNIFLGTWAWDYGYNQDNFSEERLTLNKDNTFIIQAKFPDGYTEDDKGTYEIVTDSTYGKTLRLHITSWKDNTMQNFDSADVLLSYKCYFDGEDTMHLDRFKKDFSRQGGPVYDFDPPVRNIYYRVKDGTKENLAGKWHVNKLGTPDCDWDETWTFNTDGTMVDDWTEAGQSPDNGTYNGTYEVTQKDGKNMLHQILDWGTEKPEWWYEYKSYGPNVISVQMVESTSEGKVSDAPINYYYRDIETETFKYHVVSVEFTHVVPKANSYTLVDNASQLYYFNNYFSGQEFVFDGWYDNSGLTGNKVTTSNGTTKEFWAKVAPRINKNQWGPGKNDYCYSNDVFVKNILPGTDFNPQKGQTVVFMVEGTLEYDLDGYTTMHLVDRSDNKWKSIISDSKIVKTTGKKLKEIFILSIPSDAALPSDESMFGLNFTYEKEACDRPNVIHDWKITMLDSTNTYNITYKFGGVSFKLKGYIGVDFALPDDAAYFSHFGNSTWNISEQELVGWYENSNFTESPVTCIEKENTEDKIFYAKFNLKTCRRDWYDESIGGQNHLWDIEIPVAALIPDFSTQNLQPNAYYNLKVTANVNTTIPSGKDFFIRFVQNEPWTDLSYDCRKVEINGNKISMGFDIHIWENNTIVPEISNTLFSIGYQHDQYDSPITLSDWSFEITPN